MKLDARQTRRLLLAGAVPFPKPYPGVGRISLERTTLVYSKILEKPKTLVVVQEQHDQEKTRLILQSGVAAIFIAGAWVRASRRRRVFKFSHQHAVHNFERGEWFLGPEISVDAIRTRLKKPKLAINKRGNPARGIVFVYRDQPVMTVTEVVQTAGSVEMYRTGRSRYGCDCEGYGCDCDGYGCDCDFGCDCCDYEGSDASRRGALYRADFHRGTEVDRPQGCDSDDNERDCSC